MAIPGVFRIPFILLLVFYGNCGIAGKHSSNECSAWMTNVETNNLRGWSVVPSKCVSHVAKYMTMGQYLLDSKVAIQQCMAYVKDLKLVGDGMDAWIFDIDETTLSNLPYYRLHKFGGESYNATLFNKCVEEGRAPVLPFSLLLYKKLVARGFKVFLLTGRDEEYRHITEKNLMRAGYRHWSGLMMRGESDQGKWATVYKSGKREALVKKGYRIWGNVGDQWSDLDGTYVGSRTFKLPNPMYYIS